MFIVKITDIGKGPYPAWLTYVNLESQHTNLLFPTKFFLCRGRYLEFKPQLQGIESLEELKVKINLLGIKEHSKDACSTDLVQW